MNPTKCRGCDLSETASAPVVWGTLRQPLREAAPVARPDCSRHEAGSTMPNGPLWIWDATCSSCCVLSQLTPARSERGPEQEKSLPFIQAAVPALPRLEPSDPTESRQLWLCSSKEVVGGGPDVAKDRISNSTLGFSFYLEGEIVRDVNTALLAVPTG